METKNKTNSKKKKSIASGKFFSAKVAMNKKDVTITLPSNVAEYLQLTNGSSVYWTPIDGVIQLCGTEPHMTIPLMSVGLDKFISQSA